MSHRLKQYEALLQEQGIDTNALLDEPENLSNKTAQTGGVAETQLQLPTPATTCESEGSVIKTQLLHHQGRSNFVDK